MVSRRKAIGVATFALAAGFIGGFCFISSGIGFALIAEGPKPGAEAANGVRPAGTRYSRTSMSESFSASGQFLRADRDDLSPSDGHEWVFEPVPIAPSLEAFWRRNLSHLLSGGAYPWQVSVTERHVFAQFDFDPAAGELRTDLVEFTKGGRSALDLEPAFFDRFGRRRRPNLKSESRTANGRDEIRTASFTLPLADPQTIDDLVYFGVERPLTDAEERRVEQAQTAAKEQGLSILPPPRVGQPYHFDLTTVDGRRLRAEDFAGKAVLITAWSADSPTRVFGGSLAQVRKSYTADELVIIGLSLEESAADARATLRQLKVDCPLVVVPNDPKVRALWTTGGRITRLPFYFLIDRNGVLRSTSPYHRFPLVFHMPESVALQFGRRPPLEPMKYRVGPPRPYPKPRLDQTDGRIPTDSHDEPRTLR